MIAVNSCLKVRPLWFRRRHSLTISVHRPISVTDFHYKVYWWQTDGVWVLSPHFFKQKYAYIYSDGSERKELITMTSLTAQWLWSKQRLFREQKYKKFQTINSHFLKICGSIMQRKLSACVFVFSLEKSFDGKIGWNHYWNNAELKRYMCLSIHYNRATVCTIEWLH